MSKTYVLVPLFNRFDNIYKTIEYVENQTYKNIELIIIDHGSEFFKPINLPSFVTLLRGSTDDWWSGAMNIGLKHILEKKITDEDYVLLMNDDVIFDEYLIESLIKASRRELAIVSAITLDTKTGLVLDANNYLSPWRAKHSSPHKGKSIQNIKTNFLESDVLKGRGVLYPITVVKKIGFINEKIHYRSDPEWSYRAKKIGYRLGVVPSITVKTVLNTQVDYNSDKGLKKFKDYLFSKHSTQNLHSAWVYFRLCFGSLIGLYCMAVFTLRAITLAFYTSFIKN